MKIREELNRDSVMQFIKFGIVGVSNTVISYGIDMLGYYVLFNDAEWNEEVKIAFVTAIAFVVSVTNSYFWNNKYVFNSYDRHGIKKHMIAYFKTMLSYALTGLIIAPLIKIWANGIGIPYWISSICSLVVTIPLNFILNKFWAFKN